MLLRTEPDLDSV